MQYINQTYAVRVGSDVGFAMYELATETLHYLSVTAPRDQADPAVLAGTVAQVISQWQCDLMFVNRKDHDITAAVRLALQICNKSASILQTRPPADADPALCDIAITDCPAARTSSLVSATLAERRAVGALLMQLANTSAVVTGVSGGALSGLLRLPPCTINALRIFAPPPSLSAVSATVGNGEGLSLFGLLSRSSSVGGRNRLRDIMLRPQTSLDVIKQRQQRVAAFADAPARLAAGRARLRRAQPLAPLCSRIARTPTPALFRRLVNALDIAAEIQETVEIDGPNLRALHAAVTRVIGPDGGIVAGASAEVDQARAGLQVLAPLLSRLADEELRALPRSLGVTSCRVSFVAQIGYALLIEGSCASGVRGVIQGAPTPAPLACEQSFMDATIVSHAHLDDTYEATATTAYGLRLLYEDPTSRDLWLKTPRLDAADAHVGDAQALLASAEQRARAALAAELQKHDEGLRAADAAVADHDVITTLASVGTTLGWTIPEVKSGPVGVHVKGAWHPLLRAEPWRPLDITLTPGEACLLCAAPRTGKSTVIETVGIVTYLALIGSMVPAQEATVGLADSLCVMTPAPPGVARASSFTLDAAAIVDALRSATDRSVVLLDDPGAGTCALDATAIAVAASSAAGRAGAVTLVASRERRAASHMSGRVLGLSRGTDCYKVVDGVVDSNDDLAELCTSVGWPSELISRALELRGIVSRGGDIEDGVDLSGPAESVRKRLVGDHN